MKKNSHHFWLSSSNRFSRLSRARSFRASPSLIFCPFLWIMCNSCILDRKAVFAIVRACCIMMQFMHNATRTLWPSGELVKSPEFFRIFKISFLKKKLKVALSQVSNDILRHFLISKNDLEWGDYLIGLRNVIYILWQNHDKITHFLLMHLDFKVFLMVESNFFSFKLFCKLSKNVLNLGSTPHLKSLLDPNAR